MMRILWLLSLVVLLTEAYMPRVATSWRSYYEHVCSTVYNCTLVDFAVESLTLQTLVNTLESSSFEQKHAQLRQFHTNYFVVVNITNKHPDLQQTYQDLDRFLTERPWWIIKQYPREYVHGILGTDSLQQLILERVPGLVEEAGRAIVRVHFPQDCTEKAIYVKTSVGSWGNDIIVNQKSFFERYPSLPHLLYVTDTGTPGDQVAYIEKHHCPQLIDKHQCAFLRISNCSVPQALLDCHTRDCIKEGLYVPDQSPEAVGGRKYVSQDGNLMRTNFYSIYPNLFPRGVSDALSMHMIDVNSPLSINNTEKLKRLEQIQNAHTMHWLFNVLYRPNSLLGLHIQDLLAEFYTSHTGTMDSGGHEIGGEHPVHFYRNLSPQNKCIALHIRMGDRHLNNTNMIHWCQEHTNPGKQGEERARGEWIDGSAMTMGRWHDMGCSWRLPFGAVSLEKYVEAAVVLNEEVKDLFVMTDDYHWLHRALAEYKKSPRYRADVRLHIFPTHVKFVHKSRMSLQATAEWWAGIEAARHCEGFVGHMGSAATYAVYWALCFHHKDQYWKCPPFYFFD